MYEAKRNSHRILVGNPEGKTARTDVDGSRIILKWILYR
jgi:hypothetical protein